MKVELLDKMGNDLTVVNAARVSYNVEHEAMAKGDIGLIKYLARHGHWTPFAHCFVQFRIKAPVFVARQLVKHQVGLVWNEVSRRYVDYDPEFYIPTDWRARGGDSKQGSSQTEFIDSLSVSHGSTLKTDVHPNTAVEAHNVASKKLYKELLSSGVCPEQARMILPLSSTTEWWWSGSLLAFHRVCKLRCAKDTQKETREVANMINDILRFEWPICWQALADTTE
jgi:thymidylate synthase (FAD)